MSKFIGYLNEQKSKYGDGISFIDLDETLFYTKAKIHVIDKNTGELITKLDNQQFNSYKLKDNEKFNFDEFRDAKLFRATSDPITPMVDRIKRMIKMLKQNERGSKIIFLTARSDFDNKQEFLNTFRDLGIDVDFKPTVYIERSGNLKTGTVPQKKEQIILKYLKEAPYRRVRMIDDHMKNVTQFMSIVNKIPASILSNIRKSHNIPDGEPVMTFYGLHIDQNGKLNLIDKKETK
jgi:hypothetical protein